MDRRGERVLLLFSEHLGVFSWRSHWPDSKQAENWNRGERGKNNPAAEES
jgi:hypothetical protein